MAVGDFPNPPAWKTFNDRREREDALQLRELMERNGFTFYLGPDGSEWYVRPIKYKGREAMLAVSDEDGHGVPIFMEDPAFVRVCDRISGEFLTERMRLGSLEAFLDSIRGVESLS